MVSMEMHVTQHTENQPWSRRKVLFNRNDFFLFHDFSFRPRHETENFWSLRDEHVVDKFDILSKHLGVTCISREKMKPTKSDWLLGKQVKGRKKQRVVPYFPYCSEKGVEKLNRQLNFNQKESKKMKDSKEELGLVSLPLHTETTLKERQNELKEIWSLVFPTLTRLRTEIQFTHYSMEVPLVPVCFTPLGKTLLQDSNQIFNPGRLNILTSFMQLMENHSRYIVNGRFPYPYYLKSAPRDQVIFFDRMYMSTIQIHHETYFYVPVYFQSCYLVYCVILCVNDLNRWNWLESQWVQEHKAQLKFTQIWIRIMQLLATAAPTTFEEEKEEKRIRLIAPGWKQFRLPPKAFHIPKMKDFVQGYLTASPGSRLGSS